MKHLRAILSILLVVPIVSFAISARADDLFYDDCGVASSDARANASSGVNPYLVLADYQNVFGMTCQQVTQVDSAFQEIGLVLQPAIYAMQMPGFRESMAANLAALGLSAANPAVLSVTAVGAVGVSVFYLVMKQSIDECAQIDREQLKEEIIQELERKYGLKAPGNVHLDINN